MKILKSFVKGFKDFMRPADIPRNENELIDLAIGNYDDDMNIYQVEDDLRSSGSLPMIFAFLYYKKDWDKDIFDDKLYNSLQYTEELEDMFKFVDYTFPSEEEIQKIIEKELKAGNSKLENDFKSNVEEIIREFQYKEGFEDRINTLKQLINQ